MFRKMRNVTPDVPVDVMVSRGRQEPGRDRLPEVPVGEGDESCAPLSHRKAGIDRSRRCENSLHDL